MVETWIQTTVCFEAQISVHCRAHPRSEMLVEVRVPVIAPITDIIYGNKFLKNRVKKQYCIEFNELNKTSTLSMFTPLILVNGAVTLTCAYTYYRLNGSRNTIHD